MDMQDLHVSVVHHVNAGAAQQAKLLYVKHQLHCLLDPMQAHICLDNRFVVCIMSTILSVPHCVRYIKDHKLMYYIHGKNHDIY